ncbi:MAG: glycosyltransferase [Deltaproteobacteria bacterium]|nr:glycosyltransferase [Deltaproteobacteria bacterium]
MQNKIISICIPSYNRPKELLRLLKSIDLKQPEKVEIVICEDCSPKRNEINEAVKDFILNTKYEVKYYENEINIGYDKNLKELILKANGDFIVFMGDDDEFMPEALDKLIDFLENNKNLGYVLKSHRFIFKNGNIEKFRYYNGNKFFKPCEETYIELFRKSVFISGFTINRNYIKDLLVNYFDGTLLFQLYLLAEVALKYECAYFDTFLTQAMEEGVPFFGNSESEKELYTPGTITVENSLNFLKGFFKITNYIDKKYNMNSTKRIKIDMSKYFYPSLAIQREKGLKEFLRYVKGLNGMGFNITIYYYIYLIALIIFGKKNCDGAIVLLKKILGKTPKL